MNIPGGSLTRVSTGLQSQTLLSQIRMNAIQVFREQQRIATGQRILSVSDDPIGAEQIARFTKTLQSQEQVLRNLEHADGFLSATDDGISDINELLNEASRIASEQASSLQSADEREAQSVLIDGLIQQIQTIGNRQYQGLYLFAGRDVNRSPFGNAYGRVSYNGDVGSRDTLADNNASISFNLVASELFKLREPLSGGYANFNAQLSGDTRLAELRGATNAGVRLGRITVTEAVGPGITFDVDFTGADTVNDAIARFNDAAATAGSTLTLSAFGNGLRVTSGGGNAIQIDESANGTTASDLGIRQTTPIASPLTGATVLRRVTETTRISDLGPGFALPSGITIRNGTRNATVTFGGATTVGDVLNLINTADVGVRASINAAGNGIDIENLVAGTALNIGENGGTDAAALGIKTTYGGTTLASINGGRGLHPVDGVDFTVTDAAGISFGVDVNGLTTVQQLLDAINSAATTAGSSIVAQTSPTGGGIRLTGGAGAGSITVAQANLSPVADELGLLGSGTATQLDGRDVFAFRQSGVFSALYRLRDALASNNTSEITEAGAELDTLEKYTANMQGQVGARSRAAKSRREQTEAAVTATTILLSQVKDVDLTEAITKFQQAQTALQSTLLTGSKISSLSLLDFLR